MVDVLCVTLHLTAMCTLSRIHTCHVTTMYSYGMFAIVSKQKLCSHLARQMEWSKVHNGTFGVVVQHYFLKHKTFDSTIRQQRKSRPHKLPLVKQSF